MWDALLREPLCCTHEIDSKAAGWRLGLNRKVRKVEESVPGATFGTVVRKATSPGQAIVLYAPLPRALLGQIAWFLFYPPPTLAPPPRLHRPPRLLPGPSPLPALQCALTPAQSLWMLPLPPPLVAQDLLQLGLTCVLI